MSHQLKQFTSKKKRISEIDSSFSSSQRSLKLQSQRINLQLHDQPSSSTSTPNSTSTLVPKTKTKVDDPRVNTLPFRKDFDKNRRVIDVSCGCFGNWPKNLSCNKRKPAMVTSNEQIRGEHENGNKDHNGEQMREKLQREVSVLKTMLSHEEKIREIMQQAYNRKPGMPFTFPNNIPPEMKEVLAELVLVEDEIARLESQIENIQKDVKSEHEATKKQTYWSLQNTSTSKGKLHGTNGHQQGTSYDNTALRFINKAINGGSSVNDFTISYDKLGIQTVEVGYLQNHTEKGVIDSVIPKRNGMQKPSFSPLPEFRHQPASPLRDFRHPTPKLLERSNTESRPDLPRKALSGAKLDESSSGTKWQPNKLSETIMKTLIQLYVRLIRSSRQSELEKSGPISRHLYNSVGSFRTEPGVSLSTSLLFQKDSKQQDPYGVFNIEGAISRDIGPYKNLVIFLSSSLNPKFVSHHSSMPLVQKLRGLLSSLQKVDIRSLTDQQKLAFWINVHNACVMHGYLKFGVPYSPDELLSLLNKATLNVGGKIVNAQAIEHCILQKPTPSATKQGELHSKEAIIHEQYGLQSVNSNVIFALCSGTRSSPAVRIYTAEGVTSELEKSKQEYLLAFTSVTTAKKILLPELVIQNMLDFANDMDSLVHWICQQLPTSGSLRKSIVECLRGVNNNSGTTSTTVHVEKMPFQFEFQYLLQV